MAGVIATASLLTKHMRSDFTEARARGTFCLLTGVTEEATAVQIMKDVEVEITGRSSINWSLIGSGSANEADAHLDDRIISAIRTWLAPEDAKVGKANKRKKATPRPVIRRLDTVAPEKIDWLWPNYLAWGKLNGLVGDPGVSKSMLTIDIAARVTTGRAMPDGSVPERGGVVFVCGEDADGDTIVPRLIAAEADMSRCVSMTTVKVNDSEVTLSLDTNLQQIEEAIIGMGMERVIVVIDPLNAFLGSKRKSWVDQDLRGLLTPLSKVAERTRAAIILVTHFNRGEAATAIAKVGGGTGLIGAVRSGLMVANHPSPKETDKRVVALVKTNIAKWTAPSFEYEIYEHDETPAIRWIGPCDYRPNDLIQPPPTREERDALSEAEEFLKHTLADGPRPSSEIERLGCERGHSKASLKRAKPGLYESLKVGYPGTWYWRLVGDARVPTETAEGLAPVAPVFGYCKPKAAN